MIPADVHVIVALDEPLRKFLAFLIAYLIFRAVRVIGWERPQ